MPPNKSIFSLFCLVVCAVSANAQNTFTLYSLPSGTQVNQLNGRNDELLVATDNGFHTLSESGIWATYTTSNNLPSNDVRSIGVSESQIRLGFPDRWVATLDGKTWHSFQFHDSLSFNYCSQIKNLSGFWHYGTDSGQVYIVLDTLIIDRVAGYDMGKITGISETSQYYFIALSTNGILLNLDGTIIYLDESSSYLPSNNVLCGIVHEDIAYDGTDKGLYVADFNVGPPPAVKTYTTSNSLLPSNRIQALHVFNNTIWIGTDQGLVKWRSPNDVEYFNVANSNLPSNDVSHIASTASFLWVATADGSVSAMKQTVSSGILESKSLIEVRPNPVSSQLNLIIDESAISGPFEICLIDPSGRTVLNKLPDSEIRSCQIDVSDLADGLYHLVVTSGDIHQVSPVVVMHH